MRNIIPGCSLFHGRGFIGLALVAIWLMAGAIHVDAAVTVLDYWHTGELDGGVTNGGAATTLIDSGPGGHNLTVSGPAMYSTGTATTATAHTGSFLCVNFTNSAFASNNVVSTLQDNFGVEAWVNPVSTSGNPILVYNGNTGNSGWGFCIQNGTYQGLYGGVAFFGSAPVALNTWTHLALVQSNGVATLYVNGVAAGSTLTNTPNQPSGNFELAAQTVGVPGQFFTGQIDEVRVFSFAPGQFSTNDLLLNASYTAMADTTNLLVGSAAGINSVALEVPSATTPWVASTNNTWLHLSASYQNGTGCTNVIFTYDANTSAATRTGTLTIAGSTVYVTQAGSNYVSARPLTTLVSYNPGQNFYPQGVAVDGAGNVYIANTHSNIFSEWLLVSNTMTNLVTTGLNNPTGVAMDTVGNVYIADSDNFAIRKWLPATRTLVTVTNDRTSVGGPWTMALDAAGDMFIVDFGYNRFIERSAANGTYTTLASGFASPQGVACDPGGNHVYISDNGHEALKMWTPISGITTLISSGLMAPGNVAVDGSGNLYIANPGSFPSSSVVEWVAASGTLNTVVSGLNSAVGIALDATGNLYIADANNQRIVESPNAFVNTAPITESGNAGADVLPTVLPASENLLPPFAPSSDAGWLTITGATNGVVSFAFTTNNGASSRTAHITVLGKATTVTQAVFIPTTPPRLTSVHLTGSGVLQFSFTNSPSATFTVWSATNLLTPFTNWTMAGAASNAGPGLFQFTSPPITNSPLFYRVTSP